MFHCPIFKLMSIHIYSLMVTKQNSVISFFYKYAEVSTTVPFLATSLIHRLSQCCVNKLVPSKGPKFLFCFPPTVCFPQSCFFPLKEYHLKYKWFYPQNYHSFLCLFCYSAIFICKLISKWMFKVMLYVSISCNCRVSRL